MPTSRDQADVVTHDRFCDCESCREEWDHWKANMRDLDELEADADCNARAILHLSGPEFERWLAQEPPSIVPEMFP